MNTNPLYIFSGGGSGGHLYPGISIAQYLSRKQPDAEIVFLCTAREIDKKILSSHQWKFISQPVTPIPRNLLKVPAFLKNWHNSCKMTADLIKHGSQRAVVCGLGGFASGAALKTARKMGVPTAMLNPDALPGKANKFCRKYADQIFVQWEETVETFGRDSEKCMVTGCPIRNNFYRDVTELSPESLYSKQLLVFGGSLGGHNVNTAVLSTIEYIQSRQPALLDGWKIVHITGPADYKMVAEHYSRLPYNHQVVSYCEDMDQALKSSSLVICRAGASTLAELTAIGLGSILVPYPYHKDNHQHKNAEIISRRSAAVIVEDTKDKVKTAALLYEALKDCLNQKSCYEMAIAARNISHGNAAEIIGNELATML